MTTTTHTPTPLTAREQERLSELMNAEYPLTGTKRARLSKLLQQDGHFRRFAELCEQRDALTARVAELEADARKLVADFAYTEDKEEGYRLQHYAIAVDRARAALAKVTP